MKKTVRAADKIQNTARRKLVLRSSPSQTQDYVGVDQTLLNLDDLIAVLTAIRDQKPLKKSLKDALISHAKDFGHEPITFR